MKRPKRLHRPAMVGDPCCHGRRRLWGTAQTLMRHAKILDRPHHAHPLVQWQGLACQRPAPTRQGSKPFTERRVEPFDVGRVDHPVALRATSARLDACWRGINKAALRVNDATTLGAFDHVGAQDGAPGPQPRPPARARAHGLATGRAHRSDGRTQPISTAQQRTGRGAAADALDQPPDQGQVALLADLAAPPQAGLHHHGHGHPDHTALLLDAQLVGLHLSEVPWWLDQRLLHGLALPPRARPPIRSSAFVEAKRRHQRLHGTPMGEQRHDEAHRLGRGAQAVKHRACGGAARLMARVADEPRFLLRMDTDIAPASLASGRAVPVGAERGCGVHDAPPGCAWTHCHEEYVWTPVCCTTSPYHGLVWSYPVRRHIQETHKDWAFCKGCDNLIWKSEYDRGKGWCDMCVIQCFDCLDEEKY